MLPQISKTLSDLSISPEKELVMGVSGGADSLCLLHYLVENNYKVVVAHLDHSLRTDSATDAEFVRGFGEKLGCDVVVKVIDVGEYARQGKLSIEEAAREARYRFLFEVAEERRAQAVLVAHHADDQVETVLMHILRGAGLAGMRGMQVHSINPAWSSQIPLVRPLLMVWRWEIQQYCSENGITPRIDESNQDTTYYRNRLRHELLPNLESYNSNVRQSLWRLADTAAADYRVLQTVVDEAWESCAAGMAEGYVSLNIEKFLDQPLGVQRALLRRAISMLRPGLRDIDYASVERARSFIHTPSSTGQADLIAGLKLEIEGELLYVMEWGAVKPQGSWPSVSEPVDFPVPGSWDISPGWEIKAEHMNADEKQRQQMMKNADSNIAWLDADRIEGLLTVRSWKAGDRFSPLGMQGKHVKVADFFINQKVPQSARGQWPLLVCGEKIVWVVGLRIAYGWRVTGDTQKIVKLTLIEKP
jgi:tRNA(Ile)-lysidine synthase